MTYAVGGTIQGTDFNGFQARMNTIWGTGQGNRGYGQSNTVSSVSVSQVVAATEWSTLIQRLNSALLHENNAGSGIGLPVTGNIIAWISNLDSTITNANSAALSNFSNGTDVTSSTFNTTWNTATPANVTITRTCTFSSGDAARYFFNCGGRLIFNISATDASGTAKGADWVNILTNVAASHTLFNANITSTPNHPGNQRGGSGGSLQTSNTVVGYWTLTTSNQSIIKVNGGSGTADYGGNNFELFVKGLAANVSGNGDNGNSVIFTMELTDAAADSFNDNVNLTISSWIIARPPKTSDFNNVSWATPTIT